MVALRKDVLYKIDDDKIDNVYQVKSIDTCGSFHCISIFFKIKLKNVYVVVLVDFVVVVTRKLVYIEQNLVQIRRKCRLYCFRTQVSIDFQIEMDFQRNFVCSEI